MANLIYFIIISVLFIAWVIYWLYFHKFKSSSNNIKVLQLDLDWNVKLALHTEILGFSIMLASVVVFSGGDILIGTSIISLFDSIFTFGLIAMGSSSIISGKANALYREMRELLK